MVAWLIAAIAARQPGSPRALARGAWVRLLIVVAVIGAAHITDANWTQPAYASSVVRWLGAAMTVLGIGIAFWARAYLARQWGMPMTQSSRPQLITKGPYRWIRHPIYSGILLAGIGTFLAVSYLLIVAFAVMAAYFIYASYQEEAFLGTELGREYLSYKQRTKMFIPYVY